MGIRQAPEVHLSGRQFFEDRVVHRYLGVVLPGSRNFLRGPNPPKSRHFMAHLLLVSVWGMAPGKRSRDLGTTFTYGMIIGMLFPIMGLIFLFQPGVKAKAPTNQARADGSTKP
jgi:hypothetical protein